MGGGRGDRMGEGEEEVLFSITTLLLSPVTQLSRDEG